VANVPLDMVKSKYIKYRPMGHQGAGASKYCNILYEVL